MTKILKLSRFAILTCLKAGKTGRRLREFGQYKFKKEVGIDRAFDEQQ